MKKSILIALCAVLLFSAVGFSGCNKKKGETLSDYEYTINNLYAVDALSRVFRPVDSMKSDKAVGIYYMIWHGQHGITSKPYDITDLLANDPVSLWDPANTENSPVNALHYWGEPLYGYYNSQDEWVVRRHMELLSLAGVDYLGLDTTNIETYDEAWLVICKVLQEMADDGFGIPKIVFYTHTFSEPAYERVIHFYDMLYSTGRYRDVWYTPNGKPMIIAERTELERYRPDLLEFFDVRSAQWPGDAPKDDGVPWMSFKRPQEVMGGSASVSVAQQLQRFSEAWPTAPNYRENASWGRGYTTNGGFGYEKERILWGDNFQEEWDYVIANPDVNKVFVTSFNEWVAQKINVNGVPTFTDCFNMEYSRDVEPMKGGFGDNYMMQLASNIRAFKGGSRTGVNVNERSVDIDSLASWNGVPRYKDPRGDAMERSHIGSWNHIYTDTSNRNDIVSVQAASDSEYLYLNVGVAYELIESDAENWMNVYLNVIGDDGPAFSGYNYVLNRSRSLTAGTATISRFTDTAGVLQDAGNCDIRVYDANVVFRIPLSKLGLSGRAPQIAIKVTDNIQNFTDPADFYVSGDSAPIGGYSYGYGM